MSINAGDIVIKKLEEKKYKLNRRENKMKLFMCSPSGKQFVVKVTSLSKRNAWLIKFTEDVNFYILVYEPYGTNPKFCILSCDEMKKEKDIYIENKPNHVESYGNPDLEKMGLNFNQPFPYENKWDSLPK